MQTPPDHTALLTCFQMVFRMRFALASAAISACASRAATIYGRSAVTWSIRFYRSNPPRRVWCGRGQTQINAGQKNDYDHGKHDSGIGERNSGTRNTDLEADAD